MAAFLQGEAADGGFPLGDSAAHRVALREPRAVFPSANSRLVSVDSSDVGRDELFAATPPLEANKLLFKLARVKTFFDFICKELYPTSGVMDTIERVLFWHEPMRGHLEDG